MKVHEGLPRHGAASTPSRLSLSRNGRSQIGKSFLLLFFKKEGLPYRRDDSDIGAQGPLWRHRCEPYNSAIVAGSPLISARVNKAAGASHATPTRRSCNDVSKAPTRADNCFSNGMVSRDSDFNCGGGVPRRERGSVQPDGVGYPAHRSVPIDQHDIEARAGSAPMGIFGQENFGSTHQPRLLTCAQRCRCICQGRPRLHLDEGNKACLLGNGIDLPGRRPDTAAENGPTISRQGRAGLVFGGDTGSSVGQNPSCHR